MAKEKKGVTAITDRDVDFAQWYTDIVLKAELVDYSNLKGCIIYRPYGYAIWENIQKVFDGMLKESGHENVYMPMFIPESMLEKEKSHVQGFAPEVAWVTHGGSEELAEKLCVRPTSEVLFCEHYKNILQSYRDLPKLYNQWCSVVRWEKTTRPFLRGTEFLWQEGHTVHETSQEAVDETLFILDRYEEVAEKYLAMPVVKGKKSQSDKFAGAVDTYTIECMMHDGKALQSGTSHYFGDGFAKAFEVQFLGRDNKLTNPFGSSWGISTRLIGGLIMTHGDNNGLVMPPRIAPVQLVVVPIAAHKEGVVEAATEVYARMKSLVRADIDLSDNSPGWKFAQHEMRGVPIRLELGPKDIESGSCVLVRRDTREKISVPLAELEQTVPVLLETIQNDMLEAAKTARSERMFTAKTLEELAEIFKEKGNVFVNTMWCESEECEAKVKELPGITSRCMPFDAVPVGEVCAVCGKPTETVMMWGSAY